MDSQANAPRSLDTSNYFAVDSETGTYLRCLKIEQRIWSKKLQPVLRGMYDDLSGGKTEEFDSNHRSANLWLNWMLKVFHFGDGNANGYGYGYKGPVTDAFIDIQNVNQRIETYNGNGHPRELPFLEVHDRYVRFENALKEAVRKQKIQTAEQIRWGSFVPFKQDEVIEKLMAEPALS